MAQYRFSAQVIGRSSGRSSVAAAAYRAGVSLADERTGLTHDFSRRQGVLSAEILAPDNAPDWMRDRAELWNAVEKIETRSNSQLAREIQVSLPHELDDEQRRALLHEFVRAEFVAKGMIADVAIHAPDRDGDARNHHAHVMLTMRELMGAGFHPSKATDTARGWNAKENLELWREAWADHQNRTFERLGLPARVDHRSLEARGIDREPTQHLGPAANDMERRGQQTRIGDENRAIDERNDRRADNHQAAAVINLELARLQRDEARALASRQAGAQQAQTLSLARLQRRHGELQAALETRLDSTFGEQRATLTETRSAAESRLESSGWRKILRDVSGRTRSDQIRVAETTAALLAIERQSADETAALRRQLDMERASNARAADRKQDRIAAAVSHQFDLKRQQLPANDGQAHGAPGPQAPPEKEPVKREFEDARNPRPIPPPVPTERRPVSTPTPAPSPSGGPPAAKQLAPVPKVQPTPEAPTRPAVRDYWTKAATPATPAQESTPAKEQKPTRDYWNEQAKPDRERPTPTRDRDFDRER